jgi:transcription elongation factor Elf1
MSDATVDWLTGATILKAVRRGVCLELETQKGSESHLVILGANRMQTDLHCLGCGEERLVEVVETAGKQEAVCGVCARSWKL